MSISPQKILSLCSGSAVAVATWPKALMITGLVRNFPIFGFWVFPGAMLGPSWDTQVCSVRDLSGAMVSFWTGDDMGCCPLCCWNVGAGCSTWHFGHEHILAPLWGFFHRLDCRSRGISIPSQSSGNKDHAFVEGFAFWLWSAFPATTISTTKSHLLRWWLSFSGFILGSLQSSWRKKRLKRDGIDGGLEEKPELYWQGELRIVSVED